MKFKINKETIAELVTEGHSKNQVTKIIFAINGKQHQFDELMKIFLGSDEEMARRAAWAMSYIVIKHPTLVDKWFPKIIANLSKQDQHPAIYRNTFRFMEVIKIPRKHSVRILDAAYSFILNRTHPVAIRAFAMSTAMNVVRNHPQLAGELRTVVNEVIDETSPAIRSRGRKVLQKLSNL